jgi:hypothetical protein
MQAKPASSASTAPPSTTPALPGSLNSFPLHAFFSHATTGNPLTWTVSHVGKWLVSIEMGKYCQAFADAPINGQCLHDMDDETLRDLGVTLSAHRTTMLRLIRKLFGLPAASEGERLTALLLRNP